MSELKSLIEISRFYGDNPAFVIAGGGNTSYKNSDQIWIKASGIPLAGIGDDGFVSLSRRELGLIESNIYSEDPLLREEELKADMKRAIISPENLRPSVETSLHNLIDYSFVIHTHPTLVNALMCAMNAKQEVEDRFGEEALYVEYTDPGFILFKKLQELIGTFEKKQGKAPQIIFLQNHGVFVGADTVDEIKKLYDKIDLNINSGKDLSLPLSVPEDYNSRTSKTIKQHFASRDLKSRSVQCALIDHFVTSPTQFQKISKPFSPDIIVYCKSNYLFLQKGVEGAQVIEELEKFEQTHGYYPKVVIEEQGGLIVVEENDQSMQTVIEVFLDLMKISYLSESFGGPHFMTPDQIHFIDNWEVEHYRRKVAKDAKG